MIKKNKKSKITIDKLAMMVANGFDGIEKRMATKIDIEELEKRMATKIDIEGLKNQIEGVNKRIDDLATNRVKYTEHNALVKRVEVLEQV